MDENQRTEQLRRIAYMPVCDEKESLLRAIDVLSMEVLRLKSENEILSEKAKTSWSGKSTGAYRGYQPESLWMKVVNYYKREGLKNTLKKILLKAGRK